MIANTNRKAAGEGARAPLFSVVTSFTQQSYVALKGLAVGFASIPGLAALGRAIAAARLRGAMGVDGAL
jgi:hypothetical protein